MFEKSLYDLIRGLRNHKGNEKEYIQKTLKECRAEVRSQDMDVKATALLKLIYLEMVGHDMSWASFHVLEVMSSPKYHQKRVGYLGAVQSFRPDTEVLMLATNLLKKDLGSTTPTVISLPIATLPHVITPSLALSTLQDLIPRMSHSHANIRKKTLVTLYRLALVYPEALRAAWPKIKEQLMNPDEDPSVTAAIINVVCELGWRRPHDFLPLAPRLFDLLVDGGNNWMAIKLIKLFATLTPLEPRLVRKLLPPLTNIIRTTPAMSLLYECINGIIQGGILGSAEDISGSDEIATLCVNKLRGMIMIDGDPNLKYVALLAFNKIVTTHPFLVSQQEDVILDCIDSPDITIRIQALDLVQGMVTADNLVPIVSRLMKQLKSAKSVQDQKGSSSPLETSSVDSGDEEQTAIVRNSDNVDPALLLPEDYRVDVIGRILFMCSKDNYSSVDDFDWYIDVLTQLVRMAPISRLVPFKSISLSRLPRSSDISGNIGDELRSVAVKVHAMRSTVVRACDTVLVQLNADTRPGHKVRSGALSSVSWILGEFSVHLIRPSDTLTALLQLLPRAATSEALITTLQAIFKIFASIAAHDLEPWTTERKSRISLMMARIIDALEGLVLHPDLEVQGRAIEFTELLKLTAEAAASQTTNADDEFGDAPLLLTQAIPSLFQGWDLNSVATGAQKNVPVPVDLDLELPIHSSLRELLSVGDNIQISSEDTDDFETYYHQRPASTSLSSANAPAITRLNESRTEGERSYQQPGEDTYLDADIIARRKLERMEKNKDDPFYIPSRGDYATGASTPIHNILHDNNGPDLDIDSIPIMELDLNKLSADVRPASQPAPKARQKMVIAADETLHGADDSNGQGIVEKDLDATAKSKARRLKQSLLQVDSSHIGSFNLEGEPVVDVETRQREEAEMQKAMKEVERLRLEMQRANERIQIAQGVDAEGTVVAKKKKGRKKAVKVDLEGDVVKVKKKKARVLAGDADGEAPLGTGSETVAITKKKKKKQKGTAVDAGVANDT